MCTCNFQCESVQIVWLLTLSCWLMQQLHQSILPILAMFLLNVQIALFPVQCDLRKRRFSLQSFSSTLYSLCLLSAANECCWVLQFQFVSLRSTCLISQLPCSCPYPLTATMSCSWYPLAHCPHNPITIAWVTQPEYRRHEGWSQAGSQSPESPRLLVCQIASCCRFLFLGWLWPEFFRLFWNHNFEGI